MTNSADHSTAPVDRIDIPLLAAGNLRPADTFVEVTELAYDGSDGEGSHFYRLTWRVATASAWVVSSGSHRAVEWMTGPAIVSLVHVMTEPGETPAVIPLHSMEGWAFPRWVVDDLRAEVREHLEETECVEVAA